MSTRSAIAIPTSTGWAGVYVHWDGYPKARVAGIAKVLADGGYAAWATLLADTPQGFSSLTAAGREAYDSGDGDTRMTGCGQACADCDPLFIEWVYIVHPDLTLEILESDKGDAGWRHHSVFRGSIEDALARWPGI